MPDSKPTTLPQMPPVGLLALEDHGKCWQHMSLIAQESRQATKGFQTIADISVTVFNWGDVEFDGQGFFPPQRVDTLQVNQIRQDTVAVTKATFREPPAFEITCSDVGPMPMAFWVGPPQAGLMLGLAPEQVGIDPMTQQPDNETPQQPIDALTAMQLIPALAENGWPANWIVNADKKLISSIYQTYFDGVWNDPKFDGQQFATRFGLDANSQGWAIALYERRPDLGDVLRTCSIKEIFLDMQQVFIKDMQQVIGDFVFDANLAKQQFPELKELLDQPGYTQKSGGIPVQVDGSTIWGQRNNKLFQRDIVIMRIGWFRDQPMPLSPEEAINAGYLEAAPQAPLPGVVADDPSVLGQAPLDEADATTNQLAGTGTDEPDNGGNTGPNGVPAGDNTPIQAATPDSVVATRVQPTYFLAGTDTIVEQPVPGKPVDANWPMRAVLRRMIAINGKIVWDGVEEHWDIPIILLVGQPITNTPIGIGIPYICWQIQRMRTENFRNMQVHGGYYAHPMVAMAESTADWLGQDAEGSFVRPDVIFKIKDDLLLTKSIDQLVSVISPPALPPAVMQSDPMLKQMQTSLSGNVEVLRGEPTGSDDSGEKVKALQEAAVTQVSTGDDVERALTRVGTLMQYSHVHHAGVDDVWRYYRKLPKPVLAYIHEQIAPTLEYETRCSVTTGSGAQTQRKQQLAINYNQTIDPYTRKPMLDQQSTREALDIDNDEVEERLTAQAMPIQQQHQEQGQQQPQQGNGQQNGHAQPAGAGRM